jgi:4-hydroxybenzoate polyprenyltransferase
MKAIWNEFIYNGHLQSLGFTSVLFLTPVKININLVIAVYLLLYGSYLYDRITGLQQDKSTNPERTQHLEKRIKFFRFLIPVIMIVSLIVCWPKTIIFSLLWLIGLSYPSVKKLTKYVPTAKNIFIAGTTSLFTILPFFYYNQSIPINWYWLTGFVFLKIYLMQIALDLKDISSDRSENLKTIGVLLGREKTISLIRWGTMIVSGTALFFAPMLFLGIFVSLLIVTLLEKNQKQAYLLAAVKPLFWIPVIPCL